MNEPGMTMRLDPPAGTSGVRAGVLLRRVLREMPWALLVFLGTMVLGFALILLWPAKYESEARLLALPADYYTVRDDPDRASGNESFRPEDVMNVEMQLLSSRDLRRAALERAGTAAGDRADLERALDAIGEDLQILPVTQANVIELSYAAQAPGEAQVMLDNILQSYFALRADVLTSGRLDPLIRQRDDAREELRAATRALTDFQRQNAIVDIEAQIAGAVAINTALRQNLAEARAALAGSQGALSRQRSSAARVPATVEIFRDDTEATRARAEIEAQILQLQAERGDLAARFMEGSPLIARIDSQIAALQSSLSDAGASLPEARRVGRNTSYDIASNQVRDSEAAVSGTSAQVARLQGEIAGSESRLQRLNALAADIADLQVQREVAEERFRLLAEQVEAARSREFEAGTGSTNVRIIQQPTLPTRQVISPLMLLAASVLTGMVLAAGTLFALVTSRDAPADAADAAETFDLPVVADLHAGGASAVSFARVGPLRASEAQGGVVALVGATAAEYRDSLAGLVAAFVAQGDTALVTFEAAAYRGQPHSDKLPHQVPGTPDRFMAGSGAWLEQERGSRFLARLRQHYRWIIVFVPPAETMRDTEFLTQSAAMADAVLVLVSAGRTRAQPTRRLVDRLATAAGAPRGLVVTAGRPALWRLPGPG